MAAYDAQASNVTGGDLAANPGISSATLSFTGASGASLVAFIGTTAESVDVSACTVSVTYNGSTATALVTQAPGSNTAKAFLVGWLNICDGAAHNIAVTVSGANLPHQIAIGAISATSVGSFSGATSSVPGIVTNSGNLAVTSGGTSDLVVGAGMHGDLISGTSNGTQRWIQNPSSLSAGGDSVGSTVPGAAGTVNAGGYTSTASDHWTLLAVNLVDGAAGVATFDPRELTPPGLISPRGLLIAASAPAEDVPATPTTNAPAEVASVTVTANNVRATIAAVAGLAAVAGAALDASIPPETPPETFLLLPHVISGLPYILTGRERGVIEGGDDPIISGGAR